MDSILHVVLGNALVATVLALLAAGSTLVFRRPALSHALWTLVLLKLITPSFIQVPIPGYTSYHAAERRGCTAGPGVSPGNVRRQPGAADGPAFLRGEFRRTTCGGCSRFLASRFSRCLPGDSVSLEQSDLLAPVHWRPGVVYLGGASHSPVPRVVMPDHSRARRTGPGGRAMGRAHRLEAMSSSALVAQGRSAHGLVLGPQGKAHLAARFRRSAGPPTVGRGVDP